MWSCSMAARSSGPKSSRQAVRAANTLFVESAVGFGRVQGDGGANESLQRLLVDLLALVEVDGTPGVPLETGVEAPRRARQRRPFGEGRLHDVRVRLAGAHHSVVRPHRNPAPLP